MYNEKEIVDLFQANRPYQKECVNYRGKSKEGKPYNEIIAQEVLKKTFSVYPYLKDIKDCFKHSSKDYEPGYKSEKGLCRKFFYDKSFYDEMITKELGIPIEYEMNIVSGTKVNVDLVSINIIEKVVYIIEVKGKISNDKDYYDTPETLLRCALEIETYFESLEKYQEKVIKDIFEFRKISENPQEYSLKKAILVPNESFAAKQIDSDEYKNVNAVLRKFDIKTCRFDNEIHKKRKW